VDAFLAGAARRAIGFMPESEGMALYEAALTGAVRGPLFEIGSYCGKSTIYLGAAARAHGTVVYSVDHHRGSEEHQVGQEFFDPRLVDGESGEIDTLPTFRRTISEAKLDDVVIAIVARAEILARVWAIPLGLVLIDGSHTEESAHRDYESWVPFLVPSGLLVIHDVFDDPADGGRAPFRIYRRALDTGAFTEVSASGSLRVLQRIALDL
jgi:predicted O-methyltransferase YrrM